MHKIDALFFILLLLSSCTTVLKIGYGIKKPKPRSTNYIRRKIVKYGLIDFPQYSIDENILYNLIVKSNSIWNGTSVNKVYVFNKDGFLMIPNNSINCTSEVANSILSYQDFSVVDSIQFKDLFCDSIPSFYDRTKFFSMPKEKHLFVLTWASYTGKLNKKLTRNWAETINTIAASDSIVGIYVNLDMQKKNKKTAHNKR